MAELICPRCKGVIETIEDLRAHTFSFPCRSFMIKTGWIKKNLKLIDRKGMFSFFARLSIKCKDLMDYMEAEEKRIFG